ncbi:unnamed protein product [Meganyctiphanes norvegica]|uniref:DDE Tnp4 domain-containing protein n=1 Tax=Meganyctiphanes norvegica TaxID=48144 RepID=A0AAV2S680_MEGNR
MLMLIFLLQFPPSEQDWKEIASQFQQVWDFPNCLGALDGKHINIHPPSQEEPLYLNYRHTHSIVLMAVANTKYEFVYADVDATGRDEVDEIWKKSALGKILENGNANIPKPAILPNSHCKLPFVLVGNHTFPLKSYLMRPYPSTNKSVTKRVFSYRLLRAQKVVQNAFGILESKFNILNKTFTFVPKKVKDIVMACVSLHNLLCKHDTKQYLPPGYVECETKDGLIIPGSWRARPHDHHIYPELLPLQQLRYNKLEGENSLRIALGVYFMSGGAINQQKCIM